MVLTSRSSRAVVAALLVASCAARPASQRPGAGLEGAPGPAGSRGWGGLALVGPRAEPFDLGRAVASARLTVLVFFSAHCHCLDAHDARLRALEAAFRPRGVQLFMIDSEVGATRARDDREAERRGYAFPILLDPGARLADRLGAEYATYSVVLDPEGRARYAGGIDSDKTHLRDDAERYLEAAIGDLLAGREPRVAAGKTLGCALEKW